MFGSPKQTSVFQPLRSTLTIDLCEHRVCKIICSRCMPIASVLSTALNFNFSLQPR